MHSNSIKYSSSSLAPPQYLGGVHVVGARDATARIRSINNAIEMVDWPSSDAGRGGRFWAVFDAEALGGSSSNLIVVAVPEPEALLDS